MKDNWIRNAAGRLVPAEINGEPVVPYMGVGKFKPSARKSGPLIPSCSDYPADGNKLVPNLKEALGGRIAYDRASKYDETSGKYVHWDANGDGDGIIRREGNLSVLAEMQGPGCIWRIWSALPEKGRVKIYLDGQPAPVIDMPFADYFHGKHAPFNYPELSYRLEDVGCRGDNLYFPIPYQKSCKIVAEDKWGYKWCRWVERIELSTDALYRGYWESRGYSRNGDRSKQFFGE